MRVKSKNVLFLGVKMFIIIIGEYTLEQRIFLYDAYVKYSFARVGENLNVSLQVFLVGQLFMSIKSSGQDLRAVYM